MTKKTIIIQRIKLENSLAIKTDKTKKRRKELGWLSNNRILQLIVDVISICEILDKKEYGFFYVYFAKSVVNFC